MRWFSGLFSILGSYITYYPKKKNWNPDWYIKWIGDWSSVSPWCSDLRIPPPFSVATPPPPSLNTVLLVSERMGPLSSTPSTVGCFPPPVPRAGYAPSTLLLFDTQRRSYCTRVWSYETFFVIETVIDRYLAVETWEGLNKIIIMIYTVRPARSMVKRAQTWDRGS